MLSLNVISFVVLLYDDLSTRSIYITWLIAQFIRIA